MPLLSCSNTSASTSQFTLSWPRSKNRHVQHEPPSTACRRLLTSERQVWESKEADEYFKTLKHSADTADLKQRMSFFSLMRNIGRELNNSTSALEIGLRTIGLPRPAILDLCMAPGGFSQAALDCNPAAILRGISLPLVQGGHEMIIHGWEEATDDSKARIQVDFRDITMLAAEMGMSDDDLASIPPDHPDAAAFSADRPFRGQQFDLVFCDGQVLRTHKRHGYREDLWHEGLRLLTSQLVLALQRVHDGATVIILLHRADSWRTASLIHSFASFADVQVFKPRRGHSKRTSFYLIARNIRPRSTAALAAVAAWKAQWKTATFGTDGGKAEDVETLGQPPDNETVKSMLDTFGPKLVGMYEPHFAVQVEALRRQFFAPKRKSLELRRRGGRR